MEVQTAKSALAFKKLLLKMGVEPPKCRPQPAGPRTFQRQTTPTLAVQRSITKPTPRPPSLPPPGMSHLSQLKAAAMKSKLAVQTRVAVQTRMAVQPRVQPKAQNPPSQATKRKFSEISQTNIKWDQHASGVKGRSDEERAEAKATYADYAGQRLEVGTDPSGQNLLSSDWWYCQVCLCCLVECDFRTYNNTHLRSANHAKKYREQGGMRLREGVERPDPHLQLPLAPPNLEQFLEAANFGSSRVLSLGEQDYSFSLAIARHQAEVCEVVQLVASSYLAAHDPDEPEIHVKDDGMKAHYSRKSLPSMQGMLQRNIDEIENSGGQVLHSVDATNLRGTLLTQHDGAGCDVIVFPFPRASLLRGIDTRNPKLLRNFFLSVNDVGILEPGGIIALVLLRSQFADWDTACVALEAGYRLRTHTALPDGFYQSREMSGKPWSPKDAEIYVFEQA